MRLNRMRVSCLRKNLEQLIVGKEIETRKSSSLDLQIVLHFLLNFFQFFVIFLEFFE